MKKARRHLAILSLVAQRLRHLQSRVYPGMAREQQLFKSCADYSSSCSHALSNHHPSTARASSAIIGQRKEGNVETAKHKDRSHGQFAAIGASGDHFYRIRKVVASQPLFNAKQKTCISQSSETKQQNKRGKGKKGCMKKSKRVFIKLRIKGGRKRRIYSIV